MRDGDHILSESGLLEARKDEARTLTLKLQRDGAERTVTFLPRGAGVEGMVWTKALGAGPETCRF